VSKIYLKKVVADFLKSDKPEVLCIRGKWGTGKTYAWRTWLKEAGMAGNVALKSYAYCSLFGLNSLPELWTRIFENTIPVERGKSIADPSTETFGDFVSTAVSLFDKGLDVGAKVARRTTKTAAEAVAKFPIMGSIGKVVESASTLLVRKQIVCFDDIERKGGKLDIGDVLGLASHLKDERKCKVVLILNDEKFDDEKAGRKFRTYLEKVVDVSVLFEPTVEECVELGVDASTREGKWVADYTTTLQIKNIRVIQRIKQMTDRLMPVLGGKSEGVLQSAVRTLSVMGWVEFCEGAPDMTFLEEVIGGSLSAAAGGEREKTPEQIEWQKRLKQVGFADYTELDAALLQGIKNGYFQEERTRDFAQLIEYRMRHHEIRQRLSNAWGLFWDALLDNTEEVLENFEAVVKEGVNFLGVGDFDEVVTTLREFGGKERASALIAYIVNKRDPTLASFNPEYGRRGMGVKDPELHNALAAKASSFEDDRTVQQVIQKGLEQGWDALEIRRMNRVSADDFRSLFKQWDYRYRQSVIGLVMTNTRLAPDVKQTFKTALQELYAQSPLNKQRLHDYANWLEGKEDLK